MPHPIPISRAELAPGIELPILGYRVSWVKPDGTFHIHPVLYSHTAAYMLGYTLSDDNRTTMVQGVPDWGALNPFLKSKS
jgi:hypothetical protein